MLVYALWECDIDEYGAENSSWQDELLVYVADTLGRTYDEAYAFAADKNYEFSPHNINEEYDCWRIDPFDIERAT